MVNETKLKCRHCDAEYKIKWDDETLEPTSCPFCGGDTSITDDDAYFDDEENEDDWN